MYNLWFNWLIPHAHLEWVAKQPRQQWQFLTQHDMTKRAYVMPIKIFAIWVSHDSVIVVWSFVLCGCNAYQNICHLSKSWFCYWCAKLFYAARTRTTCSVINLPDHSSRLLPQYQIKTGKMEAHTCTCWCLSGDSKPYLIFAGHCQHMDFKYNSYSHYILGHLNVKVCSCRLAG